MSGTFQKAVVWTLAIGMVTTWLLPNRQSTQVLGASERLLTGSLSTAMGTSSGSQG